MTRPTDPADPSARPIDRLRAIMARLRNPEGGCPWDLEQSFATIAPYTIEEAYEVADAIERGDMADLKGELGDLLFQVVFHSQMAHEQGLFGFDDVAAAIADKMLRRHPHVFGAPDGRDAEGQTAAWEEMKAAERAAKAAADPSALADLPVNLPALLRAHKLTKRAARAGFDWAAPEDVLDKLDEELAELAEARQRGQAADIEEEMGDLLFVMANLARKLGVDPETALRAANAKFERRFRAMEALAAEDGGPPFAERDLEAQEALWTEVKRRAACSRSTPPAKDAP